MNVKQYFNKKNNAWVKVKKCKNGKYKVTNVKQKQPAVPFKGVPKK